MTQRPLNIHTIAILIMRRVVTPVTMVQEGVGTSGGDQVKCLRYQDRVTLVTLSHWSHIKHALDTQPSINIKHVIQIVGNFIFMSPQTHSIFYVTHLIQHANMF